MEKDTGVVKLVEKLRGVAWGWSKATMEAIASELGLAEPTTGSDRWVGYRSPDPDFPSGFLEYPYGFSFRGQEVTHFHVSIDSVHMGEVCLYEPDRYNEVCEEEHARSRANFKEAVKQISQRLGRPVFQGRGGPGEANGMEAYPLGWGGELTAVWRLPNARLVLVYGQQDKELPITLDLFVCPPRVEEQ